MSLAPLNPLMPKHSKGCSAESAQRIVDILMAESGGDALLMMNKEFAPFNSVPKKSEPPKKPAPRGGVSKITPEITLFVHHPSRRPMTVPQIQSAIKETFNITMSSHTIYKIWANPPEGQAKPTKMVRRSNAPGLPDTKNKRQS